MNSPKCPLCSAALVREDEVSVARPIADDALVYTMAWVCPDCSSAFPIAVLGSGLFRSVKPLYEDGQRNT